MKERYIIMIILSLVLVLTSCGNTKNKVVDDYDTSMLESNFLKTNNEAYEIGANEDGIPIFKDTDKAFEQILIDYEDGFKAIKEEFELETISKKNYEDYFTYGWQLSSDNEDIKEQGKEITQFFDIYENSFK